MTSRSEWTYTCPICGSPAVPTRDACLEYGCVNYDYELSKKFEEAGYDVFYQEFYTERYFEYAN